MYAADATKWIALILVIGAMIFVIKAGMKILNILIMVVILIFCWYSFFTEEGSARLSITLMGKPITAYTTQLEKQEKISDEETTYFKSSKEIIVNGKKKDYVICHTKWIIRIPDVAGGL